MKLNELTGLTKAHWELHIKATQNDALPKDRKLFVPYLSSSVDLPVINHPAYFHDWWEQPEMRPEIEGYDG